MSKLRGSHNKRRFHPTVIVRIKLSSTEITDIQSSLEHVIAVGSKVRRDNWRRQQFKVRNEPLLQLERVYPLDAPPVNPVGPPVHPDLNAFAEGIRIYGDTGARLIRDKERGFHKPAWPIKKSLKRQKPINNSDLEATASLVKIPALDDNGDQTIVHSLVISPDFAIDKSVYVSGHNIGLAVSENEGESFDLLWDPRDAEKNGTVTTIALSPHFDEDGTIVLLVDNYAHWGRTFHSKYEANVYLSEDRGSTWHKLTSEAQQWMNLVAVSQTEGTAPVIIAVHQDGSLYVWTGGGSGTVWESIIGSSFPDKYPDGYSVNGVAASPGGHHLIAAFEQGGTVRFDEFNTATRQFDNAVMSQVGVYSDTSLDPDMKFVYDVRKNWLRGVGNTIAFSPNYEEDGTIFATSFYSVYASVDEGVHWKEIFRLSHNNTKSWGDRELAENWWKTVVKMRNQN
jgi:hypothetical protein